MNFRATAGLTLGARLGVLGSALAAVAGCRVQPAVADCPPATAGAERPWLNASYSPACRAALVLATLPTLDDRLAFVESAGFGAPAALADLGLHTGRTQDGPAGFDGGTAWPTPLTLAASFDPALAQHFGVALGREFYASGRNGILGPAMDMTRTWHFGRSTESFGEDPHARRANRRARSRGYPIRARADDDQALCRLHAGAGPARRQPDRRAHCRGSARVGARNP